MRRYCSPPKILFCLIFILLFFGLAENSFGASGGDLIWEKYQEQETCVNYSYCQKNYTDAAIGGSDLYVAGQASGGDSSYPKKRWLVEKWANVTGSSAPVSTGSHPDPPGYTIDEYNLPWIYSYSSATGSAWAESLAVVPDGVNQGMYVAGPVGGKYMEFGVEQQADSEVHWRVEKRDLSGNLSPNGWAKCGNFNNCTGINCNCKKISDTIAQPLPNGKLSTGEWSIIPKDIAVYTQGGPDNEGIYVAGHQGGRWRVEKRDFSSGAILWQYTEAYSGTSRYNHPEGVAVDSTGLYVVGQTSQAGYQNYPYRQLRLEKRNLKDGVVAWTAPLISSPDIQARKVALEPDGTGVYISYESYLSTDVWRVDKYTASGNLFWTKKLANSAGSEAMDIKADSSGVYIAGNRKIADNNYRWRVEGRSIEDTGDPFETIWPPVEKKFTQVGDDHPQALAIDSTGVYIVGNTGGGATSDPDGDGLGPDYGIWRIEKRKLEDTPPLDCKLEFDTPVYPLAKTMDENTTSDPSEVTLKVSEATDQPGCSCQNVKVKPRIGFESYLGVLDPDPSQSFSLNYDQEQAVILRSSEVPGPGSTIAYVDATADNCDSSELTVQIDNVPVCNLTCPSEITLKPDETRSILSKISVSGELGCDTSGIKCLESGTDANENIDVGINCEISETGNLRYGSSAAQVSTDSASCANPIKIFIKGPGWVETNR